VVSERLTYTYDANGNNLSLLWERTSNGQLVNYVRLTYTYDANGNMLTNLEEVWSNGQWVNYQRVSYAYDANGNRLTELDEQWSNGQWVNYLRRTYTYDANGNPAPFSCQSWSSFNGSFNWWAEDDGLSLTDSAGNDYSYSCCQIKLAFKLLVTGVTTEKINVPASYTLSQNYPNPFNPVTIIKFELPKASQVSLCVFDILGRQVSVLMNEKKNAGVHAVKFDGSNHASGVYFYRLQAGTYVETKKLLLLH
jgi:hypothetical protein